jgi:hypothetical protein
MRAGERWPRQRPLRWSYAPLFGELPEDFRRDVHIWVTDGNPFLPHLADVYLKDVTYAEVYVVGPALLELMDIRYESEGGVG